MNRLGKEKSPYLLQHADNPVDWYPWGTEAFEKAAKEDKPIFLSIGYSTCHWCHVMAHESFESPEVARLMNETFVPIKVDREERPDLDNVYMTVCQRLTGSGGWPLTVLLTPDKKPFYAGTYFPKTTRFGRIGMMDLIPQIAEVWRTRRQEALNAAHEITAELQRITQEKAAENLDPAILNSAFRQLAERFDEIHGGFGTAPKFPTPHHFYFLLNYSKRNGDAKALQLVEKSLQCMRAGGIWDHVGFGFHRYSVDAEWLAPHFEKMLYDQALLALAYVETYQATGKKEFAQTARELLTYVSRDLKDPQGGFYSSEDADSEGQEGKFYVWTEAEIREALSPEEAEFAIQHYHVTADGNFMEESTHRQTGENILHGDTPQARESQGGGVSPIPHSPAPPVIPRLSVSEAEESASKLELIRKKLFEHRAKRIRPHRDNKILTDWNGLMIAAFAKASAILKEPAYAEEAQRAAGFVLSHLRDNNCHSHESGNPQLLDPRLRPTSPMGPGSGDDKGRLLHRYCDGEAAIPGYLSDYTFFIWGLIELYEATHDKKHLDTAIELQNTLTTHFWDNRQGGYYFTPDDGEPLLIRQKELYDGAIPSGNSAALLNLMRLSALAKEPKFERQADRLIQAFASEINAAPMAYTQFLTALFLAWPQCGPSGCA